MNLFAIVFAIGILAVLKKIFFSVLLIVAALVLFAFACLVALSWQTRDGNWNTGGKSKK